MDIKSLVNLTERAWALDILAAFGRGTAGRQAPLLAATGAGRTAFAQSLAHLIDLNLIERNPGHGHPLRPEFRLTPKGKPAAILAAQVTSFDYAGHRPLIRRRWTLPVLASTLAPVQFGAIKNQLGPITDRALSNSLKTLEETDWVVRQADLSQRPLRPTYLATGLGARVGATLQASGRY